MARPRKETGKEVPGFTKRFEERMDQAIRIIGGLSSAAAITGGSVDQLISWKFGRTPPDFFALERLCAAAGETVEWLSKGERPRGIQPEGALSLMRTEVEHMRRTLPQGSIIDEAAEDAIALPRLTIEGSAGRGLIPTREEIEDYLSVSRSYLREVGINPLAAHVLRLSGHSMAPTLQDKDLIIIDTSQTTIRDEEVYALAFDETVLIKRLRPRWNGDVTIISDNKDGHYADDTVPASERGQLRIVGRVGGFLRYI